MSKILMALMVASLPLAGGDLWSGFVNPPDDCRIMMRWWWFGLGVTKPEIERELKVMKDAGIGGVEIQPVYPLALDDPKQNFSNDPYLSSAFLDNLKFAAETARELGLRVDITLGSGWPYGGPSTPITEASARLRIERSAREPAMEHGESLIASFPDQGDQRLYFIASRTGQQVKRAALGAEGYVLNHYDRTAIEHHLQNVGEKLMSAFGDNPPYAVFSDSLEVYGADWTDDLLTEFEKRRGYDLTPHLPALVNDSPDSGKIRHDWGQTLTELAEERYLTPIRDWAHTHHTLFRSQTYGEPPVILSSNKLVDLAEGEAGPRWRTFNTARWAASANHIYGQTVTSTETWTWLHAPSFRATPLDMKAEADLHFIEGVNQLIGHGWPYSPPEAGNPGWRFYAAAALNDHNPWFQVMPDIARYLQRVSFLMRQGKPVNDIAIYLPTHDAWANFTPGHTSVDRQMETLLGGILIPQILNAGYNFDYVDDRALTQPSLSYRILILPGVRSIPAETVEFLKQFVAKGGIVITTRREIPEIGAKFVAKEETLGNTLRELLPADLKVSPEAAPAIGFAHRETAQESIYFVANTSNHSIETAAEFRVKARKGEWWDAFTCERMAMDPLKLKLAPYESRILVFTDKARSAAPAPALRKELLDLSEDWEVTFDGPPQEMKTLHSWTDDPAKKFYSGHATYSKTFLWSGTNKNIWLNFGEGRPVEAPAGNAPGMRALLESPVRESALVYVNGRLAGSVWHPPYELEISQSLKPGANELRIEVANLAINEMAGKSLPTYRLLNLRYGERFTPQGFENLTELPAGLLGPIRLEAAAK
jgi:hypothetical protein